MDMMDTREKKYRAHLNKCMAKGMSSKYKACHSKHIEFQSSRLDDKAFSSDDDE
ncbi:hypothetical protein Golob_021688 [Gossypium lobatum]|uniref:Uncharacterized protein n=1 Tax=Gossypium lobatum TaxID=34289 RepID=A0A7J8LE98_9ROSI|nr:hypothetical protein [Gossypium lobatum]